MRAAGLKGEAIIEGYAMGSLSMTCFGAGADLDLKCPKGAAELPENVPPEQTNV